MGSVIGLMTGGISRHFALIAIIGGGTLLLGLFTSTVRAHRAAAATGAELRNAVGIAQENAAVADTVSGVTRVLQDKSAELEVENRELRREIDARKATLARLRAEAERKAAETPDAGPIECPLTCLVPIIGGNDP